MSLANKFSMIRFFLTPIFVLSILYYKQENLFLANLPLMVFLIAIATDAIDGFIARHYKQTSRLGVALDPLADKFLLTVSFITLTISKTLPAHLRIPPWVLIVVLTRDFFIIIGASMIYLLFKYVEFKPSRLGKITTFFQMSTVLSILLRIRYSYVVWNTAAVFTVLSGIHYLVRANRVLSETANNSAKSSALPKG